MPPKFHMIKTFNDLLDLRQDLLNFLSEIINRRGNCVSMNLGILRVCILNHPDAIHHVLQTNHQNYSKETFQYNLLAEITGDSLLTSDGGFWLRQRRLIQPAFHRRYFSAWEEIIYSSTSKMMDRWEAQIRRDVQPEIEAEMMDLALDIVYQTLFGVDEFDSRSEGVLRASLCGLSRTGGGYNKHEGAYLGVVRVNSVCFVLPVYANCTPIAPEALSL